MKAVWSLWTKPLNSGGHTGWPTEKHHLLSWILSFETVRRHYQDTCLITDDAGVRMLVEGLGLEFSEVLVDLNDLADTDPDWWAISKLRAYALQTEPFVHIDSDIFLWNPLPQRLETAQVFASHPERDEYGRSFYKPEMLEHVIYNQGGWLPTEFSHYVHPSGYFRSENCGILGGANIDFINYFARQALELINHPLNQPVWDNLENKDAHFILIEQYFLAACIEFHKNNAESNFYGIDIDYLFPSYGAALSTAADMGFTHLIASAKRNTSVLDRLERRVRTDYPRRYQRCLELLETMRR